MKFTVLAVILGLACGARLDRGTDARQQGLIARGSSAASRSMSMCIEITTRFITAPVSKDRAIEASQDYCAMKFSAENTYVCPNFRSFVANALVDVLPDAPAMSAEDLCGHTEDHLHELRVQASNVPSVAKGSLESFHISGECEPAMQDAIKPEKAIPKEKVPDFWYTFCVSQDCAQFLPSRHRWCQINHAPSPTHSAALCLLVRDYVTRASLPDSCGAKDMCTLYDGFVDESLHNAEAYEYVIHDGSKKAIAVPNDPAKALLHSQLTNTVAAHHLRDNAAKPVKPEHDSASSSSVLASFLIAVGITLVAQ